LAAMAAARVRERAAAWAAALVEVVDVAVMSAVRVGEERAAAWAAARAAKAAREEVAGSR